MFAWCQIILIDFTSPNRLDDDYVVFRGSEDEAASALLKGNVVLCLSEPLTIKNIKLHLTGMSRVWSVSPRVTVSKYGVRLMANASFGLAGTFLQLPLAEAGDIGEKKFSTKRPGSSKMQVKGRRRFCLPETMSSPSKSSSKVPCRRPSRDYLTTGSSTVSKRKSEGNMPKISSSGSHCVSFGPWSPRLLSSPMLW